MGGSELAMSYVYVMDEMKMVTEEKRDVPLQLTNYLLGNRNK